MRNKSIPPTMAHSLALVPENVRAALLLRHSIRPPIPPGQYGNEIPLTPEGILLAEELGRQMNSRHIGKVFSSPVGRCIETGRAVLKGSGQNGANVHIDPILSRAFVRDVTTAGPVFLEHNPIWIVNCLLQNIPVPGMRPIDQGVARIMSAMFGNISDTRPCLNLYISHDNIIAAVVYYLLGKRAIDEYDWPWMLEGVFLWYEKPELFLVWRGTKHKPSLMVAGFSDF